MILVSFSLYGKNPKYLVGALRNAETIQGFGPEWQSVFYLGPEIPEEIETELLSHGAKVRNWDQSWHKNGMFWRFTAIQEFNYNYLIFRDVDSRISDRELKALDQWFVSGKTIHVMRDHPHHNALILGGMWGVTCEVKNLEIAWENAEKYGVEHGEDQNFLDREVYSKLKKSMHLNDAFFSVPHKKFDFPSSRIGSGYVGETIDQHENFDESLRVVLQKCLNSPSERFRIFAIFSLHKIRKFFR
jgi:hypothetical protein